MIVELQPNLLHFETAGWSWIIFDNAFFEIYPVFDIYEHFLGDECWCKPLVIREDGYLPQIAHNAADGRI